MRDQRVETRPALGFENFQHRILVIGAPRQSIDGFGRQMDQLSGFQRGDSLLSTLFD